MMASRRYLLVALMCTVMVTAAAVVATAVASRLLLGATLGIVYAYVALVLVPHRRVRP